MTHAMLIVWEWCKKQWKMLLGFFVGIFSILLVLRSNKSEVGEVLKKKSDSEKAISNAEKLAAQKREESLQKNLDIFFEKNEDIDLNLKNKLKQIEDEKKTKVNSILESEDPNEEIARKLKDFLDS